MLYFILIASAVLLIGFFITRDKKGGLCPLVLKTLISLGFIGLGLYSLVSGARSELLCALFVMGGVFALVGDIFLDLKVIYPQHNSPYLLFGMSAFTVCQIFYFTAMVYFFGTNGYYILGGVLLGLAFFGSTFIMKIKLKEATVNSFLYAVMLCLSVFQSLYVLVTQNNTFSSVLFSGLVLFLFSDAVLTLTYFKGKDGKFYLILNHLTYYVGQFLIMGSLLF